MFIDIIAKGFIYYLITGWAIESVDLLLLYDTYRSYNRNITTT
jgi:hypothetical protein